MKKKDAKGLAKRYKQISNELEALKQDAKYLLQSVKGKTSEESIDIRLVLDEKIKTLGKKQALVEAEICLALAKEEVGKRDIESIINCAKELADYGEASLKKIGTSEEELEKLVSKGKISQIKTDIKQIEILAPIAEEHDDIEKEVDSIIAKIEKSNINREKADSLSEALSRLKKQGYISQAKYCLKKFKEVRPSGKKHYSDLISKFLKKAGISLENIGATKDEIKILDKSLWKKISGLE